MLTFAEEIYLLALDDTTGRIVMSHKDIAFEAVIVGAVLAELHYKNVIDTVEDRIVILSKELTGFPALDCAIELFQKTEKNETSIAHALRVMLSQIKTFEKLVLEQLLHKKVLKLKDEKILWIFPSRRYPLINDTEIVDIERRIRAIVLRNETPSKRDSVLISLLDASGLFHEILSPREYRRSQEKIEELAKVDVIGKKVHELIMQIKDYANIPPYLEVML